MEINIKTEKGYFKNHRSEMLRYIPVESKKILEVGCGEGSFCLQILRSDREVWGIEINSDASKVAQSICFKVLTGDFDVVYEQLPKNYFDCVIFNDVLEHLYAPWDVISKLRTNLSSTGVIVSSIPNFRYIDNLIMEILWKRDFRYRPEGGILDDDHIRFFTSKSITRMFNEQGYKLLTHKGINPCKSWKEKLFISLTFGFLKDARYKQFATVAVPKQ